MLSGSVAGSLRQEPFLWIPSLAGPSAGSPSLDRWVALQTPRDTFSLGQLLFFLASMKYLNVFELDGKIVLKF